MKFFLTARQDNQLSPSAQIARNFLRALLQDEEAQSFNQHELTILLHALFVERNPELLREFRQSLREVLQDFPKIAKDMHPHAANAILTYILCLLPHAEIKPGQSYHIPIYNRHHRRWELKPYCVSGIRLTPSWGLEAYTMTDNEHVFAYGFHPLSEERALEPFLVFKGMPTLAGQGFFNYVFHSLNPFFMSSNNPFQRDHQQLNTWFNQYVTTQKAKVYAFGEGAAMATAIFSRNSDINKHIAAINAYNPSLSTQHHLHKLAIECNSTQELQSKLVVNLFHNEHDRLAKISNDFPDNDHVSRYAISPAPNNSKRNFLMNHVLCFASAKSVLKLDASTEVAKRWWLMNAFSQVLSHLAFGLFVLPCRFLVLPTIRALLQHKTEALILATMVFVFSMFPLYTTPLGIAATAAAGLYLGYKMLPALKRLVGLAPEPQPSCHQLTDSADMQELFALRA